MHVHAHLRARARARMPVLCALCSAHCVSACAHSCVCCAHVCVPGCAGRKKCSHHSTSELSDIENEKSRKVAKDYSLLAFGWRSGQAGGSGQGLMVVRPVCRVRAR